MRVEIKDFEHQKSLDIDGYQELLDILFNANKPLSIDEANVLLRLFPKDSNEAVEDSLKSIIQNIECSRAQFSEIINNAPSEELRAELLQQFNALHSDGR